MQNIHNKIKKTGKKWPVVAQLMIQFVNLLLGCGGAQDGCGGRTGRQLHNRKDYKCNTEQDWNCDKQALQDIFQHFISPFEDRRSPFPL